MGTSWTVPLISKYGCSGLYFMYPLINNRYFFFKTIFLFHAFIICFRKGSSIYCTPCLSATAESTLQSSPVQRWASPRWDLKLARWYHSDITWCMLRYLLDQSNLRYFSFRNTRLIFLVMIDWFPFVFTNFWVTIFWATKWYLIHFLRVVIILLNTGFVKCAFSTYCFRKTRFSSFSVLILRVFVSLLIIF